ncbi:MAG TPA: dihydroorotase [Acidimicrobiales bacterium]
MTDELTLRRPDDLHLHLRDGDLLRAVAPHSSATFARGLVMPNLVPPVLTAADVEAYRKQVHDAVPDGHRFEPLMTIKVVPSTTADTVREARAAGAVAAKLYPEGVTTNSADGVRDMDALADVFAALAEVGMVLCVHGEAPDAFCLDREAAFVDHTLPELLAGFPDLRVVLEHVSTADAVERVRAEPPGPDGRPRLGATVTVHHLLLTLDDVVGGMLHPHHFCKPLAKRPEDRDAVRDAALGGDPRFFFGTDSAPHLRAAKECAEGCAGVFTAPVALPVLAEVFEDHGALDRLDAFTGTHGAAFYGLPPNEGTVTLVREPWVVPDEVAGVVPFRAGATLRWRPAEPAS